MEGWIKIHRKFQDWEWRSSAKHVSVFLDLLLEANHKAKRYRGIEINAGQLTTSYQAISERTKISVRGVRTVIKDLKTTSEVTHENMRHFSLITITNWDQYQLSDNPNDNLVTSRRQPSDKLTTTNKNVKNKKKEKNKNTHTFNLEEAYKDYPRKEGKTIGMKRLQPLIKTQSNYDNLVKAISNYKKEMVSREQPTNFIKLFSTFVSEYEDWIDFNPAQNKEDRIREIDEKLLAL